LNYLLAIRLASDEHVQKKN